MTVFEVLYRHTSSRYPAQISTDKSVFPPKVHKCKRAKNSVYLCLYFVVAFEVRRAVMTHIHIRINKCESNSWYLVQHKTTKKNKLNSNNNSSTKRGQQTYGTDDERNGGSLAEKCNCYQLFVPTLIYGYMTISSNEDVISACTLFKGV